MDDLFLSVKVFNTGMRVSGLQIYRKPNSGEEKTYEVYGNAIQLSND
jgi:hypothetical protein